MQRTAILNGSNVNFDKDYSLPGVAIMTPGVVEGLQVTGNTVAIGKALIQVERTATSPSEIFYIVFENTTAVTIDTSGDKKVFIQIPKANLNDPGYNQASGENIATIQVGASYPAEDFIPLASITGGIIYDERDNITIKEEVEKRGVLLQKGTAVSVISDYTFTGAEENNIGFLVDTSAGDVTLTLDPGLFDITKGLYQFTFTKTTGDSNSLIIDSGSGNTIDGGQTYTISQQWEAVVMEVFSETFMKVISTANKPSAVDIQALAEAEGKYGDYGVIYDGIDNKKIKLEKIQNVLKAYQLNAKIGTDELVELRSDGKVDPISLTDTDTIDVTNGSFGDGYPNNIFKIDNDHYCVLSSYNDGSTQNWWTSFVYGFDASGMPYKRSATVLTTSFSTSSNYPWSYMLPMGNDYFVFFWQGGSSLYATISQFNSATGTFTHGAYQLIDDTSSNSGNYVSACRMTDTTLLVTMNQATKMRKITINTASKVFTTLGTAFTIPGSNGGGQGPSPITSWGADVGAIIYNKYVSGNRDIYVQKMVCTGHDIAFSEETMVFNVGSDCYIKHGSNNADYAGGDGRKMLWCGWYGNNYGRVGMVRYDDVNGFEVGNYIDLGYRHNPDYSNWYSEDKMILSVYDYDGTGNGRYIYEYSLTDLTLTYLGSIYTNQAGTYQAKTISINGGFMYVWNNQSGNKLYTRGVIKDMTKFFGVLKEGGVTNDIKKVARYGNVSEGHTGLTPGKEFGYGRALTDTEILLFKNT